MEQKASSGLHATIYAAFFVLVAYLGYSLVAVKEEVEGYVAHSDQTKTFISAFVQCGVRFYSEYQTISKVKPGALSDNRLQSLSEAVVARRECEKTAEQHLPK